MTQISAGSIPKERVNLSQLIWVAFNPVVPVFFNLVSLVVFLEANFLVQMISRAFSFPSYLYYGQSGTSLFLYICPLLKYSRIGISFVVITLQAS